MASKDEKKEWELPHIRESHQMEAIVNVSPDFWSVKFYPYTEPGLDPVFAVVGGKRILVCRPPTGGRAKLEVIQLILDEEPETDHFACVWSKDAVGKPLLCVAGKTATIKVIDVLTGEVLATLAGHGGEINDLVISPLNPTILASASDDCTVRIWSLDPAHASQPCAAILEGDGHKETVLSLSFHASGRYLLSGGIDHTINLWTLPLFPDANTGTNIPTRIFYPHFSTSEIHADIVDCVSWYGDLILSKAANEHTIVLWSINHFIPSTFPPPPPNSAPTTHDATRDTRSFFAPASASSTNNALSLYTRHLQFAIPDSEIIFMRFALYPGSSVPGSQNTHPILAFCNTGSKVFFWDLDRLKVFQDDIAPLLPDWDGTTLSPSSSASPSMPTNAEPRKHPFLNPYQHRNRGGSSALKRLARTSSPSESLSSAHTRESSFAEADGSTKKKGEALKGKVDWPKSAQMWQAKYAMGQPLLELEAHGTEVVKALAFTGRQVAWSVDGEWCVVVGSSGVVGVLQRGK